jgi:hypothetical protein
MPPCSVPLPAVPTHPPESEPIRPPTSPPLLWNPLDRSRRRLFAQRLALLLYRKHAAQQTLGPEEAHDHD